MNILEYNCTSKLNNLQKCHNIKEWRGICRHTVNANLDLYIHEAQMKSGEGFAWNGLGVEIENKRYGKR